MTAGEATDPRHPADGQALDLAAYEHAGGYQGLRKALREMTPQRCRKKSRLGLRGRGGAGFPTGMKWSFTPMGAELRGRKYVVANADEMEPGTFKDRYLMEGNPHQLIEGLILAAYAIQADVAFIFIRGEYKLAQERLARAIAEAYAAGYLGKNILSRVTPGDASARQRRTLHVRRGDRIAQRTRGQARQPTRQAAVSAGLRASGVSPPSSTMSRPWRTCPTSSKGPPGFRV